MKKQQPTNTPLLCWDIFMENYHRQLHYADDLRRLEKIRLQNTWSSLPFSMNNVLIRQNKVIVITNTALNIIHATQNMPEMNGYEPGEIIGQTPRIFQGEATTAVERAVIRTAVTNRLPFNTVITNYRKDGSIYKCRIEGYPVFNEEGTLVNFIALENAA